MRCTRPILVGLIYVSVYCLTVTGGLCAQNVIFEDTFSAEPRRLPNGDVRPYPDPSKWSFTFWPGQRWRDSYGAGTNWLDANAESQVYLSRMLTTVRNRSVNAEDLYDPFTVTDDGLRITAAVLSVKQQEIYQVGGHRRFGSGMLLSKFFFKNGSVRIIAKFPTARGSWPALWLLPQSNKWPPEIDIAEGMSWGKRSRQVHAGVIAPTSDGKTNPPKWIEVPSSPADGFHEYGLDWDETTIRLLFDGRVITEEPTPPSLKTESMYLVINLAVGGKWPYNELGIEPTDSVDEKRLENGAATIERDYPADMIIRSVRITAPK